MPQNFEDLNDHIVFTKVKSQNEAMKMRDEAKEESLKKNVVIFFEKRYHLYLKPGQDPYQIRREIAEYMASPSKAKKSAIETSSESVAPESTTTSKKTLPKK
jgi:hypothetical protein